MSDKKTGMQKISPRLRLSRKVKACWHDFYFGQMPETGIEFAMKCKDATAQIDLGDRPSGLVARFRFRLHLSLCRACQNYFDLSRALGNAVRSYVKSSQGSIDIDSLNKSLIEKHALRREK